MLDMGHNKVGAALVHEYLEHNRQRLELVVLPHHRLLGQQANAVAAPMKSLPLRQLCLCDSVGVSKNHMVVTAKAGYPWKQILELSVTTRPWVWVCRFCVSTPPVAQRPLKTEPSQSEGAGQATTAGNHGCCHYECLGGARLTLDFGRCHPTKIKEGGEFTHSSFGNRRHGYEIHADCKCNNRKEHRHVRETLIRELLYFDTRCKNMFYVFVGTIEGGAWNARTLEK